MTTSNLFSFSQQNPLTQLIIHITRCSIIINIKHSFICCLNSKIKPTNTTGAMLRCPCSVGWLHVAFHSAAAFKVCPGVHFLHDLHPAVLPEKCNRARRAFTMYWRGIEFHFNVLVYKLEHDLYCTAVPGYGNLFFICRATQRVDESNQFCYTLACNNRIACGHGSVGRMSPCQGEGHGFESRCPLSNLQATLCCLQLSYKATWPSGKARVCKTLIMGSNPIVASSSQDSPYHRFTIEVQAHPIVASEMNSPLSLVYHRGIGTSHRRHFFPN